MITIDGDRVIISDDMGKTEFDIGSPEAFEVLGKLWLRSGWDNKYVYSFTWLGRPVIQFPEDLLRIQEVIYKVQPDVIVETGVAHGGSLIFYASLCKAMDHGRVIGVDIEIRPHNRKAIESHFLFPFITLIEGNSVNPEVVDDVKGHIEPGETVMVVLDSCHTKDHVLSELIEYSSLVSVDSYVIATDGIMADLTGAPRSEENWAWDNPKSAAIEFAQGNTDFIIEEPEFLFNEGDITKRVTYWPEAFIKRIR